MTRGEASPPDGDGAPRLRQRRAFFRRLRQFTARLETSPTVITRQINGRIPDGRVAPIHGSSSPSEGSRQGEDKPRFQGPALQTTHHCHRARSCLGPKHRRLIKVYCRFSPIITLSPRAGKNRAGSALRGTCGDAPPLFQLRRPAPLPLSHSSFPPLKKETLPLFPQRKPAGHHGDEGRSEPPARTRRPRRRRRLGAPVSTDPAPVPAPVKSGPSLDRVGWHRFIGLSGNSPVYTAEEGLNG